jgi:signal transduction histidine kinase
VTSNISEGRSLEETTDRLRRAQKAGRLGTWDWNVQTSELIWDGVEAVHGLPEGTFGGTFEGYLADMHPEDRERVLSAIGNSRDTGAELDIEYRILLPDNVMRWVSGRGTAFRDQDGNVVRLAGTCQDITDRKRAEQQKEDLFAFASHELRNPLTSILGFSRLLELRLAEPGKPLDEDGIDAIKTISSESQRMAEILETFLDLARAESQRLEVELESIDLIELLDDQIERVKAKAPELEVIWNEHPEELLIASDRRRLRQIISNLLDNALKYGGSPPKVWVSSDSAGGWVDVRIRDNGAGIDEQDRRQLFGRFYRGIAQSNQPKGLGIGLYLSRQFAERLGATLELDSPPGESAAFLLRLPLTE